MSVEPTDHPDDEVPAGLGADATELLAAIDLDEEVEKPTLDNYKSYKDRMSLETIRAHLALRTRTNANPSDATLAALETAELDHQKTVALIAWAGDISENSAKKRS